MSLMLLDVSFKAFHCHPYSLQFADLREHIVGKSVFEEHNHSELDVSIGIGLIVASVTWEQTCRMCFLLSVFVSEHLDSID